MSERNNSMSDLGRQAAAVLVQLNENERQRERLEKSERALLARWQKDEAEMERARARAQRAKEPLGFGNMVMSGLLALLMGLAFLWLVLSLASLIF